MVGPQQNLGVIMALECAAVVEPGLD